MLIRDLYTEHGELVDLDFTEGLTGDERDRLDAVRMHLHRFRAIRDRIWKCSKTLKFLNIGS